MVSGTEAPSRAAAHQPGAQAGGPQTWHSIGNTSTPGGQCGGQGTPEQDTDRTELSVTEVGGAAPRGRDRYPGLPVTQDEAVATWPFANAKSAS